MSTATQQLISGVDFVSIPTHDLEKAIAFYRDTLGLHHSGTCHDGSYAEFETGNLTLGITGVEKTEHEHTPLRAPLALHVDDVAAARTTLESRGVTFAGDTVDTGVCLMAFFADPAGNALMLHHRYRPRVEETRLVVGQFLDPEGPVELKPSCRAAAPAASASRAARRRRAAD